MTWPRDGARLDRVRRRMAERDIDALVVRAPDNVVYLSSYWPMKGNDILVFPREGDAAIVVMEPQRDEAERDGWVDEVRTFAFYDPLDPRPPLLRSLDRALELMTDRELTGRVGLELSVASQGADRMVGEPTIGGPVFFDALSAAVAEPVDAAGLLAEARSLKTEQEVERLRIAGALAARGLEHVRALLRPGMLETEVAALFEGHVHELGAGYEGRIGTARAFTLVWSGPGIRTFSVTRNRPVLPDQPTLMEIWVAADGYWVDLTKNLCPGTLRPDYDALLDDLLDVYSRAMAQARDGVELSAVDGLIRERLGELGHAGQPPHPVIHGVGARAHEPPWGHGAGTGTIRDGMVLAIEPGVYWPGGGGLRLEDTFLITPDGPEAMCGFPDDFRLLPAP